MLKRRSAWTGIHVADADPLELVLDDVEEEAVETLHEVQGVEVAAHEGRIARGQEGVEQGREGVERGADVHRGPPGMQGICCNLQANSQQTVNVRARCEAKRRKF
jgi:hypothetical protein